MNIEQARKLFVKELADILAFEQRQEYIVITPRQFLGSENFAKIAEIVRNTGGEYISAGKDSHFRIPIGEPGTEVTPGTPQAQVTSKEDGQGIQSATLHFKVTKLTVHLGRTVDQKTGQEWAKQSYGLEVDVNSDDKDIVEKAKTEVEQILGSWLPESAEPSALGIPQIDIGELNECAWLTYKRAPAKPGQAAWIKNPVEFSSWKDPPNVLLQLVKAIKKSPGEKLVLGDMEYAFSGKGELANHFISRKPVKTESAK